MKQFTFIDLFAGCGGLSYGLIKAGLMPIWANEIDAAACQTYKHNIGDHIVCKDITNVDVSEIPDADILVGGFPCQPFSISGSQNGFDGRDGDMFYQCVRIINAKRPKVFVLENVTGFVSLGKGKYLNEALRIFNSIGYHVSWKIIDASNLGVPQTRKRVFFIGNILEKENIFPINILAKVSVKEAIDEVRLYPDRFTNNVSMRHTERIKKRFSAVNPGESVSEAMERDPSIDKAKLTKQCYRRLVADQPAPTVVANFVTTTIHYCENRNLTAREAARIQSFPDSFEFKGKMTRMSWEKDLSQFEQIGNAVPPKVAEEIGICIIAILDGKTNPINERYLSTTQLQLFNEEKIQRINFEGKRGRKSKYEEIYKKIEIAPLNSSVKFSLLEGVKEFKLFLPGAMKRRRINYELIQEDIWIIIKKLS